MVATSIFLGPAVDEDCSAEGAQKSEQCIAIAPGLNIPWAVGGERYERDGALVNFPGEWPDFHVPSLRIWDARVAWLDLEPSDDGWNFDRLDRIVDKAQEQGVEEIVMVLSGTPQWASTEIRPTDAFWLGPGSASPPRNLSDWKQFVSEVSARYQGRIQAYDLWNEPDDEAFWNGTPQQWAQMMEVGAQAIRVNDPQAQVVVGAFAGTRQGGSLGAIAMMNELKSLDVSFDVWSLHWYPESRKFKGATPRVSLGRELGALKEAIDAASRRIIGVSKPMWVTEVNVRGGSSLNRIQQARAVFDLQAVMLNQGLPKFWWYAWTDLGPGELLPIHTGTPAELAIKATAQSTTKV